MFKTRQGHSHELYTCLTTENSRVLLTMPLYQLFVKSEMAKCVQTGCDGVDISSLPVFPHVNVFIL